MSAQPPIDLVAAWEAHKARVLSDRDAPEELHASDLAACPTAVHQRINGVPQLPNDEGSFANFERGHALEPRILTCIDNYLESLAGDRPSRLWVQPGERVEHAGIVGNIDFVLYDNETPLAIIDPTGTAAKSTAWKYHHALKSAFYAVAKDARLFCELVVQYGFGGTIRDVVPHWFALDDEYQGRTWRERVNGAIMDLQVLAADPLGPATPRPPWDPVDAEYQDWICKSYCRATRCHLNGRLSQAERDALDVCAL